MPHTKHSIETTYYDSDDEPCRVHRDEDGDRGCLSQRKRDHP